MVLTPTVYSNSVVAWDRIVNRHRNTTEPMARFGMLMGCSLDNTKDGKTGGRRRARGERTNKPTRELYAPTTVGVNGTGDAVSTTDSRGIDEWLATGHRGLLAIAL